MPAWTTERFFHSYPTPLCACMYGYVNVPVGGVHMYVWACERSEVRCHPHLLFHLYFGTRSFTECGVCFSSIHRPASPRDSSVPATLMMEFQGWILKTRFYMGAGDFTVVLTFVEQANYPQAISLALSCPFNTWWMGLFMSVSLCVLIVMVVTRAHTFVRFKDRTLQKNGL